MNSVFSHSDSEESLQEPLVNDSRYIVFPEEDDFIMNEYEENYNMIPTNRRQTSHIFSTSLLCCVGLSYSLVLTLLLVTYYSITIQ